MKRLDASDQAPELLDAAGVHVPGAAAQGHASAAGRWRPYQIYVLVILFLTSLFSVMDKTIVAILQEPIKKELHLSDLQLGLISGPAFALFYSVVGLPAARLASRFNRARLLSYALAFWSGMTVICGFAQTYVQLLLARVGVGMGEGACTPLSHSLLSHYFAPRQRGVAMAWLTLSIPAAAFLAPLIGSYVAALHGWRAAFLAVSLPGLLLALVMHLTLKDPAWGASRAGKGAAPPTLKQDLRWLFTSRTFVLVFMTNASMGFVLSSTNAFTASFILRKFDLTLGTVGAIMAFGMGMAGLLGTFIGGFLADRFAGARGRSYAIVPGVGLGLAGALFLIAFTRQSWVVAVVFLIAANVFSDLKNGPNYALVQNLVPAHMRATAAAVQTLAITVLGSATGPMLVGALSDRLASRAFGGASGGYAKLCPASEGPANLAAACADASAAGMSGALIAVSCIFVVPALLLLLASRDIRLRLDETTEDISTADPEAAKPAAHMTGPRS